MKITTQTRIEQAAKRQTKKSSKKKYKFAETKLYPEVVKLQTYFEKTFGFKPSLGSVIDYFWGDAASDGNFDEENGYSAADVVDWPSGSDSQMDRMDRSIQKKIGTELFNELESTARLGNLIMYAADPYEIPSTEKAFMKKLIPVYMKAVGAKTTTGTKKAATKSKKTTKEGDVKDEPLAASLSNLDLLLYTVALQVQGVDSMSDDKAIRKALAKVLVHLPKMLRKQIKRNYKQGYFKPSESDMTFTYTAREIRKRFNWLIVDGGVEGDKKGDFDKKTAANPKVFARLIREILKMKPAKEIVKAVKKAQKVVNDFDELG